VANNPRDDWEEEGFMAMLWFLKGL
jgi:hypothetical protein